MNNALSSKVVLISGGGSGLGYGLANALVQLGANVVIASRNIAVLREREADLNQQGPGRALAVECDVRQRDSVIAAVNSTVSCFGEIDILINNAGLAVADKVEDIREEDWDLVMDTNIKGTFLMSQAVLASMKSRKSGYILNIASQAAKNGYSDVASYCASKFAVLGFASALQKEVAMLGIRVHSLCPGLIQVPAPASEQERNAQILQISDVVDAAIFALTRPAHVKLEDVGLFNLMDPDV